MLASRKVLCARGEHYDLIMVRTWNIVVDTVHRSVPDGVALIMTLSMSQGQLGHTRLVLNTFLGQHHDI